MFLDEFVHFLYQWNGNMVFLNRLIMSWTFTLLKNVEL